MVWKVANFFQPTPTFSQVFILAHLFPTRIFSPRFFLRNGEIGDQNLQINFCETFSPKQFFESFFLLKDKK